MMLEILQGFNGNDFIKDQLSCRVRYVNGSVFLVMKRPKNIDSGLFSRLLTYKAIKLTKFILKIK